METQLVKSESNIQLIEEKQLIEYLDVMGLATQLSESEKKSFLQIAKAFNLNPFKREIYCSKYGAQLSIITGYEVYIKRAERSGMLDGWNVVTEGKVDDNSLKAIITIHRKDRKHPFVHEVLYSEYVQKTKEGHVTKFWLKAITMTKKVAMAQGFRLCFSDELGGMPYTQDEITQDVEHEVISEKAINKDTIQIELHKEYITLVTESYHVLSTDEQDVYTKDSETWDSKKLTAAISKLKNLVKEREIILHEEAELIKKQNSNI
jgi:phage recombination protein Bet